MNNAEWMRLLKKQRERESVKTEEVKNNASIINNGNGTDKGSDAGHEAGGEGINPDEHTDSGNNGGATETGSDDNGNA